MNVVGWEILFQNQTHGFYMRMLAQFMHGVHVNWQILRPLR